MCTQTKKNEGRRNFFKLFAIIMVLACITSCSKDDSGSGGGGNGGGNGGSGVKFVGDWSSGYSTYDLYGWHNWTDFFNFDNKGNFEFYYSEVDYWYKITGKYSVADDKVSFKQIMSYRHVGVDDDPQTEALEDRVSEYAYGIDDDDQEYLRICTFRSNSTYTDIDDTHSWDRKNK